MTDEEKRQENIDYVLKCARENPLSLEPFSFSYTSFRKQISRLTDVVSSAVISQTGSVVLINFSEEQQYIDSLDDVAQECARGHLDQGTLPTFGKDYDAITVELPKKSTPYVPVISQQYVDTVSTGISIAARNYIFVKQAEQFGYSGTLSDRAHSFLSFFAHQYFTIFDELKLASLVVQKKANADSFEGDSHCSGDLFQKLQETDLYKGITFINTPPPTDKNLLQ